MVFGPTSGCKYQNIKMCHYRAFSSSVNRAKNGVIQEIMERRKIHEETNKQRCGELNK
jgi:hypothetical protein